MKLSSFHFRLPLCSGTVISIACQALRLLVRSRWLFLILQVGKVSLPQALLWPQLTQPVVDLLAQHQHHST